jgi:PAS domain S-box-containing protein
MTEALALAKGNDMKTIRSSPTVAEAIHDLSARKDAEKHLMQMEGKYRGLLEAAPDAMVVVNEHGEIFLLNLQAEKQFGYRRDELLGQKVTNIIPEGFAERLIADDLRSTEDALLQQIGNGIELVGQRKDGSKFPIEIMLSPLESAEGILVTAAIRDITTRKKAAALLLQKVEELSRLNEELGRLERMKDDFISTVSHELRTPLTSIAGSLGLLMGNAAGNLPDPVARLLAIAHANCQRLVRLVNDILDIEKMEAGRIVFNFRRVEVRTLVEQAIEASRGIAESCGVRIRLEDACTTAADVRTDPDRLLQVIANLLSNAIKFSPADNEVLVAIENGPDVVRISVRDHGPGISVDFLPHVFERFAQADATNTRQKGGSGLGLSIVKQVVDRLGGEVGFAEAHGGGTIFHVELPCWERMASMAIDHDAKSDASRILLCEDDFDVALVLRERLRQGGFATDFAYTAADAITCATAVQYHDILVDLLLPDGDGLSLIVRLRALPQYWDTPIIVVSADPDRGRSDQRSAKLNVLDWLNKPVDFDRLMRVLTKTVVGAKSLARTGL